MPSGSSVSCWLKASRHCSSVTSRVTRPARAPARSVPPSTPYARATASASYHCATCTDHRRDANDTPGTWSPPP